MTHVHNTDVKLSPKEEESSDSEDTEENIEKAEKVVKKKLKDYHYQRYKIDFFKTNIKQPIITSFLFLYF